MGVSRGVQQSPEAGQAPPAAIPGQVDPGEAFPAATDEGRFSDAAREAGLRRHTARGTLINAAFQVGFAGMDLLRRLVVAAFLTVSEYGIWGILLTTLFLVVFIKHAGISSKFVQQAEANQEQAFQKAFTIDLLLSLAAIGLAAVALPIFALAFGQLEIILPGIVLSLALIGGSLQTPIWILYRRMEFVRQRILQAIDPCVALVATVTAAAAGAGYWSVVIGALTGTFTAAAVIVRLSPYRLRLRLERDTVRDYFAFSGPLLFASGSGLATVQGTLLIATRTIGLAGAGAVTLAGSVTTFTKGVDGIVTSTLYPAICAVRDRKELLFEAFVKSNRLALMWGVPFGLGVALFASDLVMFVFGSRWANAVVVIQAFAIGAAIDQLGFNWSAFLRALDITKPIAWVAAINVGAFVLIVAPLLISFGLPGLAAGSVAGALIGLVARTYFLAGLFSGFRILRHTVRAVAPVVPPVAVLLLTRAVESGERTPALAIAELVAYALLTVVATALFERKLLREIMGYLRRARTAPALPTGG